MFGTDNFRQVVATFATGVTVVTTRDAGGQLMGFTANAFSSLSLDPPLILVCVAKHNDTYLAITSEEETAFTVNVLASDQRELSNAFASKRASEKFDGVQYQEGTLGAPILDGVLSYLECEAVEYLEGGDHTIVVGKVRSLGENGDREPLLVYRGGYGALQSSK